MLIPHASLSPDSLRGVVEEYVSREGTEYGDREYTMDEKVRHVLQQLERGDIFIDYDPDSGTCNLVTREQADR